MIWRERESEREREWKREREKERDGEKVRDRGRETARVEREREKVWGMIDAA